MNKRSAVLCLAFIAGFTNFGQAAAGNEQDKVIKSGQSHFMFFCANCHGVNADGKGDMAELLKIAPVDLTTLKQTGGGVSVTERVLVAVDGRHKVGAGQERKMPVFSENLTFKTVYEITEYLKSIQK